MSKLKPIGSEKLTGQAKIDRMLQIAGYKENTPQSINETSKIDYQIEMADNQKYFVVKERLGYVIKKGLNESTADYIEPMKNRKYYRSYSQGLKKLNLIARELNEMYGNDSGLSLFGEQKKYTLKTPKSPMPEPMPMGSAIPDTPPPVPQTPLPPAPTEDPMAVGAEAGGDVNMDIPPDMDTDGLDLGAAEAPLDLNKADEDEEITFKTIQKLTGRLSQRIRVLNREDGMTSDEVKYVLNMVIAALDLDQLDDEDRDDIMSRLEEREGDYGDMTTDGMGDVEAQTSELPTDMGTPTKMEAGESYDYRMRESIIDSIISSYFDKPQKKKHRL